MERTISRKSVSPVRTPVKYDLIIGADLHIREDAPACRTDNYLAAQFSKMYFIRQLCNEHDCPFVVAGDIFDHWKPSPYILSRCLELLPHKIICVPGQHDLPGHNLQEIVKTGLNTLVQAGRVIILSGGRSTVAGHSATVFGWSYGEVAEDPDMEAPKRILLWHQLTCLNKQPWPGAEATTSGALIKKLDKFDLIVTGDNHQQFCVKVDNGKRWVVNPGSMMRMSSDQEFFHPAVYGWKEDGSITRIPLPIKDGVVKPTGNKNKNKESRDTRMESYILKAQKNYETKLSFTKNLEQYFKNNKESSGVEQTVWKACEK